MKIFIVSLKVLILMFSSVCFVFSQQEPPNRTNTDPRRGITRDDVVQRNLENRMRNVRNSQLGSARSRTFIRTKIVRPKLSKKLKKQLEVKRSVKENYSEFLSQKNTGIFNIIALENCSVFKKSKKKTKCLQRNRNKREFANGFSFRENKLTIISNSDIILNRGYFVSGKHSVQSIIVDLGAVDINELNSKSDGVSFLSSFIPSKVTEKVDNESNLFLNGIVAGNYSKDGVKKTYSYSKSAILIEGHTYAIRSVAYRPLNSNPLPKDKDVLVVFRIINVDEAGNATIIWKQLSKKIGLAMED